MKSLFLKAVTWFLQTRVGQFTDKFLASWPMLIICVLSSLWFTTALFYQGHWVFGTCNIISLVAAFWNVKDRRVRDLQLRAMLPLRVRMWLRHPLIGA